MEPTVPSPPGRSDRLYNREKRGVSDDDRVRRLQLEASVGELDGPAWREVRDDVWVYSTKVLASLILKGTVWGAHRRLGGLPATDLRYSTRTIDHEVAHDLATETVSGSLPILHNQLLKGQWRSEQGASIRTWATNLAILRLPAAWRKWRRNLPPETSTALLVDRPSTETEPEAVIFTLEFERYIELLDVDLQPLVRLDCDGLTDAEIAAAEGLSTKQVEYRLLKARSASRRRMQLERDRDRRLSAS